MTCGSNLYVYRHIIFFKSYAIVIFLKSIQPVTYSNWGPGEPNDALAGEDCAHISWETYAWNDVGCERNLFYICQTPQG